MQFRRFYGDWLRMESNFHTSWIQSSKLVNKTFFFLHLCALLAQIVMTDTFLGELKSAATGSFRKLFCIERRCTVNLSACRLFHSPIIFFSQRVQGMAKITFDKMQA